MDKGHYKQHSQIWKDLLLVNGLQDGETSVMATDSLDPVKIKLMATDTLDPAQIELSMVCCYQCGEKAYFERMYPYDDVPTKKRPDDNKNNKSSCWPQYNNTTYYQSICLLPFET